MIDAYKKVGKMTTLQIELRLSWSEEIQEDY